MTKVKSNAAELIIATIATILLMSSCGSQYGVCPAYAGVTEAEVGDMYANQAWDKE